MPPMVIFAGGHVSRGRYPGGQMSWIHSSRRAGQLVLIVVWRRLVGRSQASTDTRLTPSAAAPTDVQYSAAGRDQHGSAVCVRAAKLISTCAAVAFTARRHASTVYAVGVCPVCLSVRHRPVLYRNDWTNRARFFAWKFPSTYPTLCYAMRKNGYLQKLGYFPLGLCPKLRTLKMSPRQVDRVVNKARRRVCSNRPHSPVH